MVGLGGRLPPSTAKLAVPPDFKEVGGREPKVEGYPPSPVRGGIVRSRNPIAVPFNLRFDKKEKRMPPLRGSKGTGSAVATQMPRLRRSTSRSGSGIYRKERNRLGCCTRLQWNGRLVRSVRPLAGRV